MTNTPIAAKLAEALRACMRQLKDQQSMPDDSNDDFYNEALRAYDAAKGAEPPSPAMEPVAWIQYMPSGGQELRWLQQSYRSDEANLKRIPLYAAPFSWQPIETAEENRIVLVACANGTVWIASKHDGDWLEMGEAHDAMMLEPTHWQPLPQPPTAAPEAQDK